MSLHIVKDDGAGFGESVGWWTEVRWGIPPLTRALNGDFIGCRGHRRDHWRLSLSTLLASLLEDRLTSLGIANVFLP